MPAGQETQRASARRHHCPRAASTFACVQGRPSSRFCAEARRSEPAQVWHRCLATDSRAGANAGRAQERSRRSRLWRYSGTSRSASEIRTLASTVNPLCCQASMSDAASRLRKDPRVGGHEGIEPRVEPFDAGEGWEHSRALVSRIEPRTTAGQADQSDRTLQAEPLNHSHDWAPQDGKRIPDGCCVAYVRRPCRRQNETDRTLTC